MLVHSSNIHINTFLPNLNRAVMRIKNQDIAVKKVALLVIELFLAPLRMTQDIYYHIFTKKSRAIAGKKSESVNKIFQSKILKNIFTNKYQTTALLAMVLGLNKAYAASDSSSYSFQSLESASILSGISLGLACLSNKLSNLSKHSNCEHLKTHNGDDIENGEIYRRCKSCGQYLKINDITKLANKNLAIFIYTCHEKDINKAFRISRVYNTKTYNQNSISKTHEVLFCRIKNSNDFIKVINSLKTYKSGIKLVSIGAHGSRNGFDLGYLNVNDANSKIVFENIKSILEKNGTLVLESCRTGEINGIAQKASKILEDRLVIAPNTSDQSFFAGPKNAYGRKFLNNCSFSLSLTISLIAYSNFLLNGYYSKKFFQNLMVSTFFTPLIFLFLEFVEFNGIGISAKFLQKIFELLPELTTASGSHMRYKNGNLVQARVL